jgi:hypothetical protein
MMNQSIGDVSWHFSYDHDVGKALNAEEYQVQQDVVLNQMGPHVTMKAVVEKQKLDSSQPVTEEGQGHLKGDQDAQLHSPSPTLPNSTSPLHMDSEIKAQGEQLFEILQMFKQATTSPLSTSVLETPSHKVISQEVRNNFLGGSPDKQRKIPRLSAKSSKGKYVLKLAQDLIAKKCGIVQDEDSLEETTLQQYLDMYKKPLPNSSMQAILKLPEVAAEK